MRGGVGRDIFWAYAASGGKVASWIVVSAVLARVRGLEALGLLALVRATLALFNYASAGLSPAMIHFAAKDQAGRADVFRTGVGLSGAVAAVAAVGLVGWYLVVGRYMPSGRLIVWFGLGVLVRLAGDGPGAVLQSTGRVRREYQFQAAIEAGWAILAGAGVWWARGVDWQVVVGGGYLVSAAVVTGVKGWVVRRDLRGSGVAAAESMVGRLLGYGGLVVAAQVADFLYAPTDFILIRWLIDLKTVGVYAPAVQIDSGLVLAVAGISAVILPRSAAAFGRGEGGAIWRDYVRGTVASLALLFVGAAAVWAGSSVIFRVWLGDEMVATQRVLPWVLVSTVVGGSARVGGAVLLGVGRARAYAISVLAAGVANVVISYVLVRFFGMGLVGIVIGTVVAVVGRCGVWMPWYVWKTLKGGWADRGGVAA